MNHTSSDAFTFILLEFTREWNIKHACLYAE